MILSAFRTHNRMRFEIFAYSISQTDCSDQRKVFLKLMDRFVHFPQHFSDEQCARAIAQDGIHILVNLNGHAAGNRNGISALCSAPRQLLYLAYPGTMGASLPTSTTMSQTKWCALTMIVNFIPRSSFTCRTVTRRIRSRSCMAAFATLRQYCSVEVTTSCRKSPTSFFVTFADSGASRLNSLRSG